MREQIYSDENHIDGSICPSTLAFSATMAVRRGVDDFGVAQVLESLTGCWRGWLRYGQHWQTRYRIGGCISRAYCEESGEESPRELLSLS